MNKLKYCINSVYSKCMVVQSLHWCIHSHVPGLHILTHSLTASPRAISSPQSYAYGRYPTLVYHF